MPTIGEMEYGYDHSGVENYLSEIKADYIEKAKAALLNTSSIKATCDAEWEGKAKENFKVNLDKDAQHVADQFDTLYQILVSEIYSLEAAMTNKDETLIEVD